MTKDELVEKFRALASEIAERDLSHVTEEQAIADLGMDSLSTLELVGELEREFGVSLPEEDLVGVRTVKDLLDLVHRGMGDGAN